MSVKYTISITLVLFLSSSCSILKRPQVTPHQQHQETTDAWEIERILYPEGYEGGAIERTEIHYDATGTVSEDRPVFTFSEAESAHVRVRGFGKLPDEGLTISLDLLKNEFHYPYKGRFISDYGMRNGRMHTGIDIKAIPNDTIRAALPGVVRMSKYYSSYGNIVVIRHYCGLETVYSHASKNLVEVNDIVEAGTPIALAGRTGRATTEHLHFEVRAGSEPIDPKLVVDPHQMDMHSGMLYVRNRNGTVVASHTLQGVEQNAAQLAEVRQEENQNLQDAIRESGSTEQHSTASTSNAQWYRVKKGDTLSAIARKHNTTVKKLCELNNIRQSAVLQINQRLRVR